MTGVLKVESAKKEAEVLETIIRIVIAKLGENSVTSFGKRLHYHNAEHAKFVRDRALEIAYAIKILSHKEITLLEIAALFHDFVQDKKDQNELRSAVEASLTMSRYDCFSDQEIQRVIEAIKATKMYFDETSGSWKQTGGKDILAKILCDADLATLGMSYIIFSTWGDMLFQEQKAFGSRLRKKTFLKTQVEFLKNHNFFTDEANKLFNQKAENIKKLENQLNSLA